MSGDAWTPVPRPRPGAAIRLFCLPYSGASAAVFFPWAEVMPQTIEVCPVQLPGHGTRLAEALYDRLDPLVEQVAAGLAPLLDRPFAFFGHSMGALLAFELARYLRRRAQPEPLHLFVSGHGGPQLPDRNLPLHQLPDPELIGKLRDLNGTPPEVLAHEELLLLLLPVLRADFAVCETYGYTADAPVACGITAMGGLGDPYVTREELAAWGQQTTGYFSVRVFPGDHFYINSARQMVLQVIATRLEQVRQDRRLSA